MICDTVGLRHSEVKRSDSKGPTSHWSSVVIRFVTLSLSLDACFDASLDDDNGIYGPPPHQGTALAAGGLGYPVAAGGYHTAAPGEVREHWEHRGQG